MRDKIEIIRYNKIDSDFDSIINLHQLIFKNTRLNNSLIYFDSNFPLYFRKIIEQSKDNLVVIAKIDNKIAGFIHYKLLDDTVFLNNICISSNFQEKGVGKYFLMKSLKFFTCDKFVYFTLDVFLSNVRALTWYKKMGLEIISQTKWIKISQNNFNPLKPILNFLIENDTNGFQSIFVQGKKIATIVNKTIIISELSYLEMLPCHNFQNIITNQDTRIFEKRFECIHLDTSCRMQGKLKELLQKLN